MHPRLISIICNVLTTLSRNEDYLIHLWRRCGHKSAPCACRIYFKGQDVMANFGTWRQIFQKLRAPLSSLRRYVQPSRFYQSKISIALRGTLMQPGIDTRLRRYGWASPHHLKCPNRDKPYYLCHIDTCGKIR